MSVAVSTKIVISPDLAARAFAAQQTAVVERSWGSARCYVQFSGGKLNAGTVRILQAAGFKVFARPRVKGKQIYIGYDNATGQEYAQAIAVAKVFKAAGVACYEDADED